MTEYDTVQYIMPFSSVMKVSILPEYRDSSVTVLHGTGIIGTFEPVKYFQYLPLREEVKFSSFKCLSLDIVAVDTELKLAVRGNHYITEAYVKIGENTPHILFCGQKQIDSFLFTIYSKLVPLQIFVGDESSRVYIEAVNGSLGVMGSPLTRKYRLLPHSCVTVNSLSDNPCTVEVKGRNRMIRISLLRENENLSTIENVSNRLNELRISSMNNKCIGPIVLVIGPPNVGKTSLCHYLLNKAIDKGMNPIYIDLDVRKNSISLPGSICLSEIKTRRHITKGFKNHEKIILHLGSVNVNNNNNMFYHYLIRKMGQQLKKYLVNNVTCYSGVIIDMYGPLGQNESTVSCVLNSFDISRVLVVGDKNYYNSIKNILVDKATEYIPQPENIEPTNEILETKFRNIIFRKYFYGRIRIPQELDTVEVKLSEVKLFYGCLVFTLAVASTSSMTINRYVNFCLQPLTWGPYIEYHVLGVSKETDVNAFLSAIEVKHFVCFTKIDLVKGIGVLLSPEPGPFSGKIFIAGDVIMTAD